MQKDFTELSASEILNKVISDSISNLMVFGFIGGLAILFSFLSWWLAIILLTVLAVITLIDGFMAFVIQFIFTPFLFYKALRSKNKENITNELYMLVASIVKLAEVLLLLGFYYILYLYFIN